ncbi:DNRLRE domain-containing protein [Eubacterium xylanophilum]|uniref:DNRLRE domain-containing protein n=1 Tax=Eubacterium xylanophilum TaxID=39497 RepID=UPI00047C14D9|nr:DNRLRE domain-containing protein [Eubacterium xylanophilum]
MDIKSHRQIGKGVFWGLVLLILLSISVVEEKGSSAAENKTGQSNSTQEKCIKKTGNMTVFDLGEGKKRAEIYSKNIRFRDIDGTLKDYDCSLKKVHNEKEEYVLKTTLSDKESFFPNEIEKNTPVKSVFKGYGVEMYPVEETYTYDLEGKKKVRYSGKSQEIIYEYESLNEGLKETIKLQKKKKSIDFVLKMDGVLVGSQKSCKPVKDINKQVIMEEGESLCFFDEKTGETVGGIPFAYAVDSSGSYSEKCRYAITFQGKQANQYLYKLRVILSPEIYDKMSYPVSVDPSLVWDESSISDMVSAYVCSSTPNSCYTIANTRIMCVGKRDTNQDVCRSYIRFQGLESLLTGKYIDSATLALVVSQTDSSSNVNIRQVNSAWNTSTLTYANQPIRENGVLASMTLSSGGSKNFTLNTDSMNERILEGNSFYGFEMTDSEDDTNVTSTKSTWIYNSHSYNGSGVPKLTIVYYDRDDCDECPHLSYRIYKNDGNWTAYSEDGFGAGGSTTSSRMRAIQMDLDSNNYNIGDVKYMIYKNNAWTNWVSCGSTAGNTSDSGYVKAIKMKATDNSGAESSYYDIYYRVYVPGKGWLGWALNEQQAGDYGSSSCISAVEALLVPKLKYRLKYKNMSTGTVTTSGYYDGSSFGLHTNDVNEIISIGTQFADPYMQQKHSVYVRADLENGGYSEGNIGKNSLVTLVGGSETNKLTDFTMRGTDVSIRARYNIEHNATKRMVGAVEGKWNKDLLKDGNTSVAEVASIQIVPRTFHRGEKACYSSAFIPEENGYCFSNSSYSFGYPSGYAIPLQRYTELFGEILGTTLYNSGNQWGGSCYGMCSSSVLFKSSYWNFTQIRSNIDKNVNRVFSLEIPRGKKDDRQTKLIEYCQIVLSGIAYWGAPYEATAGNYQNIISYLQNNSLGNKYVMYINYVDNQSNVIAHAVVPIGVHQEQNGTYTIDLYDPNYPGETRHASVTQNFSSFSYGNYNFAGLYDMDDLCNRHGSYFSTIWNNVSGNASNPSQIPGIQEWIILGVDTSEGQVQICNEKGESIEKITGVTKMGCPYNKSILYRVPIGKYKVLGKNGKYKLTVADYNKSISCSMDNSAVSEISICEGRTKLDVTYNDSKEHKTTVEKRYATKSNNVKEYVGNKFELLCED